MKKITVTLISLLTVITLAACDSSKQHPEQPVTEPVVYVPYNEKKEEIMDIYVYPVTPDNEDWNERTVLQKIEACRIPEETLESLSNNALVVAVVDHPFIIDLYVTDSFSTSVPNIPKKIDAYKEILSRSDSGHIMLNGMRNLPESERPARTQLRLDELGILCLFDSEFDGQFTMQEALEISNYTSGCYLVRTEEEAVSFEHINIREVICCDGTLYVIFFMEGKPGGVKQLSIE